MNIYKIHVHIINSGQFIIILQSQLSSQLRDSLAFGLYTSELCQPLYTKQLSEIMIRVPENTAHAFCFGTAKNNKITSKCTPNTSTTKDLVIPCFGHLETLKVVSCLEGACFTCQPGNPDGNVRKGTVLGMA